MNPHKEYDLNKVIQLYNEGLSSLEIKETLQLPITARQVQRVIKKFGLTRSDSETRYRSMARGRMIY